MQASSGTPFTITPVSLTPSNAAGKLANFTKFTNYSWTIATASGGIANFATNNFAVDTSAFANDFTGGGFAVGVSGNSLVLKYLAAPLVYPQFTSLASTANGGMSLSGVGGAGQAYVLMGTTNLAPPGWLSLATNIADTNGLFQFTDSQATNYSTRFYRITTP